MKKQILIIILLILNSLIVFVPMDIVRGDPSGGTIDGDGIFWENSYARLEVYPHTSYEIIRQRQFANLTWKESDNTIDVAFRFNDALSYGRIWKWDGASWNQVSMQHTTYNGKHYYYYQGFNVVQGTTYKFKWEYDTPINNKGKWDLMAKLSSDSISTALSTGRYVMLDPWWDSSYGSRMTITIPASLVGETVTNFPLLLNFSGNTDVTDNVNSGGWDIRFIASDNSTEYYYHFADNFTDFGKVWVKIPSIDEITDTVFNMYFDNANADRSSYYSHDDTWHSDYLAVYYLNSTYDFSGNGYDLTATNPNYGSHSSSIGNCFVGDGTNRYFTTSEDAIVDNMMDSDGMTVIVGAHDTFESGDYAYIYEVNNTGSAENMYLMTYTVSPRIHWFADHLGASAWATEDTDYDHTVINMNLMTTGSGGLPFTKDWWTNTDDSTWFSNTTTAGMPGDTTGRLTIGDNAGHTFRDLTGHIDTFIVRTSTTTEHEARLWAYNFKGDGLINYGPRISLVLWISATTDVTDTSAVLNSYVNSSNQDDIKCGFIYGTTSPVTNDNADANVTASHLYNPGDSYSYNITGLTPATIYYISSWGNDSDGRFSYSNESSFFTPPSNATSLEVSGVENGISLEWVHGTGYDVSILLNTTGELGSGPTNGTVIYNGSDNSYEHTGLTNNTQYYYTVWEWSSEGGFSDHSLGNASATMLYHNFEVGINTTTDISEFNATLNGWFTGDSLSGDYTCGFWYGLTNPLTEDSKDGNVTSRTDSQHTVFTSNLTGLSDGKLYYVKSWISNASAWETSIHGSFTTIPTDPSNLVATTNENRSVSFTWSKAYTSPATTVVVRKVDAYASDVSDGTIVYNSTGTSYVDTANLLAGSHWYYRAWGHVNPISVNYSEDYVWVSPFPPTNVTTNILSNSTFTIKWDAGTGAETTLLRRKLGSYPDDFTDGDEIYNGTNVQHNIQDLGIDYFYSLWSYANETYSGSVNLTVGGIVMYCFDEDTNDTLDFDIFISNADGSQTFDQRNISNGYILNVSDLPTGDAVKFVVSANQNYSRQSEYFNFGADENQTITYLTLSFPPEDKISVNVTCINESGGGNSYPPFTLDGDLVTILPDNADAFTKVFVNYTYYEYERRVYYRSISASSFYLLNAYLPPSNLANLYLIEIDDRYDQPLEGAYIEVKNKVNNTYVVVSSLYTDANGQTDLHLIQDDNYIFVISKDGYVTENASWTPGDLIFTKTFKLELVSDVVNRSELGEVIILRGVIYDTNVLTVTFSDKEDAMIDSHFVVSEYYNNIFTYMGEYNGTTESSITFNVNIDNISRMHTIRLYMNHTNIGTVFDYLVYVNPIGVDRDEGNWFEQLIADSGLGEWEYGWLVTFVWVMPCIILIAGFGAINNPGIGILGAGMWSGWLTYYLIMPNESDILVFSGIALVVAFIVIILKQGKKVVNE